MSARWEERQDGRNAGRDERAAGCPVVVVVAVLILVPAYVAVHLAVWALRVLLS